MFPLVGQYFDFDCARLSELNVSAGTFALRVEKNLSELVVAGDVFRGRFLAFEDSVLTLVT